jgi:hypothetical protein
MRNTYPFWSQTRPHSGVSFAKVLMMRNDPLIAPRRLGAQPH